MHFALLLLLLSLFNSSSNQQQQQDVFQLSPPERIPISRIRVVAAVGDSVTAAFAAKSDFIGKQPFLNATIENRGVQYNLIMGEGNLLDFNPTLLTPISLHFPWEVMQMKPHSQILSKDISKRIIFSLVHLLVAIPLQSVTAGSVQGKWILNLINSMPLKQAHLHPQIYRLRSTTSLIKSILTHSSTQSLMLNSFPSSLAEMICVQRVSPPPPLIHLKHSRPMSSQPLIDSRPHSHPTPLSI